jgi:hypothetical protein
MRAVISGVTAGVLVASLATSPLAQPTQAPDLARAQDLYTTANQAMTESRFDDAARDFGAAYDITHDPILFFKIGVANEKAGHCDTAQIYFSRYLKEAKPDPKYQQLAQDHVRACGGDARNLVAPAGEPEADLGSAAGSGSASEGSAAGSGSAAPVAAPPSDTGSAAVAPAPLPPAPPPAPSHAAGNDAAWLMVGGGLAFVTIGAVLAYSASSSEQDLKDLYVGLDGTPPTYDATVAKRYQSLVDEGNRYEHLSWAAFGVAGGFAVAATILFLHDRHHDRVEPTPTGVAIKF